MGPLQDQPRINQLGKKAQRKCLHKHMALYIRPRTSLRQGYRTHRAGGRQSAVGSSQWQKRFLAGQGGNGFRIVEPWKRRLRRAALEARRKSTRADLGVAADSGQEGTLLPILLILHLHHAPPIFLHKTFGLDCGSEAKYVFRKGRGGLGQVVFSRVDGNL